MRVSSPRFAWGAQELGLEGFGASGNAVLAQLVEELLAAGEVAGALRAGGTGWVPACHAAAQQSALSGFYEQNGWVGYDFARKCGLGSGWARVRGASRTAGSAFARK